MKSFEGQASYYDQNLKPLLAAKALERALDEKLDYLLTQQMHQQQAGGAQHSPGCRFYSKPTAVDASGRTSVMSVTSAATGGGGDMGSFSAHASWVGRSGATACAGCYPGVGATAAAAAASSSRPHSAASIKGAESGAFVPAAAPLTPNAKSTTQPVGATTAVPSPKTAKWATNLTKIQYQQQLQNIARAATLVDRCEAYEQVAGLVERIVTKYNACAMAALALVPPSSSINTHAKGEAVSSEDGPEDSADGPSDINQAQIGAALDIIAKAVAYIKPSTLLLYEESLKQAQLDKDNEQKRKDSPLGEHSLDIKEEQSMKSLTDEDIESQAPKVEDEASHLLPHFTVTRMLIEQETLLGDFGHLASLLGYPTPTTATSKDGSPSSPKPQPLFGGGSRGFSLTRPTTADSKASGPKTPMPQQQGSLVRAGSLESTDDGIDAQVALSPAAQQAAHQRDLLAIGKRQAELPLWEALSAGYGCLPKRNTNGNKTSGPTKEKDGAISNSFGRTSSTVGGNTITNSPVRGNDSPNRRANQQQHQHAPLGSASGYLTVTSPQQPIATTQNSRFAPYNDTFAQQQGMLFNWYFSAPQLTAAGQFADGSAATTSAQRRQQSPTSASELSFPVLSTSPPAGGAKKGATKGPTPADTVSSPDLQTVLGLLLASRLMRLRVVTLNNLGCILRRKRCLKDALACMAAATSLEQRLTKLLALVVKSVYGTRLGSNGIVGTNVGVAAVLGLDTVHTPFIVRQIALEKMRLEELRQAHQLHALQQQQLMVAVASPYNHRASSVGGASFAARPPRNQSPTGSSLPSPQQTSLPAGAVARQASLGFAPLQQQSQANDNVTPTQAASALSLSVPIATPIAQPVFLTQVSLASNVTDAVRLISDTHREVAERINKRYYEWLKALQDLSESPFVCTPLTNMSSLSVAMGKYPEGLAYASEAVAQFLNFEAIIKAKAAKAEQTRQAKFGGGGGSSSALLLDSGALTRVPSTITQFTSLQTSGPSLMSPMTPFFNTEADTPLMGTVEGVPKTSSFYKGTLAEKELSAYQGLGAVLFQNLAMALEPTDPSGAIRSFGVAIERSTSEFGASAPATVAIVANRDGYTSWLENRHRALVTDPQQEFPLYQQLMSGSGTGGGRRQSVRRQSMHNAVAAILGASVLAEGPPSTPSRARPSSGSTRQTSPSSPSGQSPKGKGLEGGRKGNASMAPVGFAGAGGIGGGQLTPLQQQQLLAAGYPAPQTQSDLLDAQTVVVLAAGLQTASTQGPVATNPTSGAQSARKSVMLTPSSPPAYGRTGSTVSLLAGRNSSASLAGPLHRPSAAAATSELILRAQAIQGALSTQPPVTAHLGSVPAAKVAQVGRLQRLETYKADHNYTTTKEEAEEPAQPAGGPLAHSANLSGGPNLDLNSSFPFSSNKTPSVRPLQYGDTKAFLNTSAGSTASAPPSVLLLSNKFADSHEEHHLKANLQAKRPTATPMVLVSASALMRPSSAKPTAATPSHRLASPMPTPTTAVSSRRPSGSAVGFLVSIDDPTQQSAGNRPVGKVGGGMTGGRVSQKQLQFEQQQAVAAAEAEAKSAAQQPFFDPSFAGLILEVETPLQRVGDKINAEDSTALKTAIQQQVLIQQQQTSQEATDGKIGKGQSNGIGLLPMVPRPPGGGSTSFLPPQPVLSMTKQRAGGSKVEAASTPRSALKSVSSAAGANIGGSQSAYFMPQSGGTVGITASLLSGQPSTSPAVIIPAAGRELRPLAPMPISILEEARKGDDLLQLVATRLNALLRHEDNYHYRYQRATKIQCAWRRVLALKEVHKRRTLKVLREKQLARLHDRSARTITAFFRRIVAEKVKARSEREERERLECEESGAAIMLQKYARRWLAKQRVARLKVRRDRYVKAVTVLQRLYRSHFAHRRVAEQREALRNQQSLTLNRETRHIAASKIQATFRAHLGVIQLLLVKGLRKEALRRDWRRYRDWAARLIQRQVRRYLVRKVHGQRVDDVVKIHRNKERTKRRKAAQIAIAALWRGYLVRCDPRYKSVIEKAKAGVRRRKAAVETLAATRIQTRVRMHLARKELIRRREVRDAASAAERNSGPFAVIPRDESYFR